jgi:hypothetical protein
VTHFTLVGSVSVTLLCAATHILTGHSAPAALPATGVTVCIVGAQGLTVGATTTPVEVAARADLLGVENVDGAYVQDPTECDESIIINVLSREHGLVDRDALFSIEDRLEADFGTPVTFIVRAHQGRDMRTMAGPNLLFARG